MTDLTREQRRALETAIRLARQEAETAADDALRRLGVADAEAPAHLDAERRKQRNRLRAHARALGDARAADGAQAVARLTEQAAYVQWHRLLFARFLIERKLLREETGATLSLNDCREIAFSDGTGADEWSIAAGFAATMLPGVFPADDPVESLVLAPEHARTLRQRLLSLNAAIFQADDSLGWTYQFWRAAEKKAVNEAQVKIGSAELPAVTQLFTEPYMVRFLLHNTLGAWWAGKLLAAEPALAREASDEVALRVACALPGYTWDYLRIVQEDGIWRPAAGTFPGWPGEAKALTVLDPCCGSGHFLTEALVALAALRRDEEGLSPAEAVAAVLRDNLAGLEIDGRCVQIAAFNLALIGWRIGGPGTALPTPNVAWVGAPPPLPKAEFAALANGDAELQRGLEALHDLFRQAPLLGSLIEPLGGDLVDPHRLARIEDSIEALIEKIRSAEPEKAEGVVAARGMADAAAILSRRWCFQITNVPFLGERRQNLQMKYEIGKRFSSAKADLSTTILDRMRNLAQHAGTIAAVTPQSWLLQPSYQDFRKKVLLEDEFNIIASLGPRAFETITGERVDVALLAISRTYTQTTQYFSSVSAAMGKDSGTKAALLTSSTVMRHSQTIQLKNPDQRIMLVTLVGNTKQSLGDFSVTFQGIKSGDDKRFVRFFWEMEAHRPGWRNMQTTVEKSTIYGGAMLQLWWGNNGTHLTRRREEGQRMASQRRAVSVSQMSSLPSCILSSDLFDSNVSPIFVKNENLLAAVFEFATSSEFYASKQALEAGMKVNNGTLLQIPFDLSRWQDVAAKKYPNGLPDPYSDDPTQWFFHGHPCYAVDGTELHVALGRLAGYCWPAETDTTMRLSTKAQAHILELTKLPPADTDGLLPLTPLLGERGLGERLRAWCAAAWGSDWRSDTEASLVAAACNRAKDKPPKALTLEAWLRTHAARQHAKLFYDRPFLWWITDSRADGFMAVVHYHRLTRDTLSRLTFHVLGDYIVRLGNDLPRAEAARILQRKLEQIIEGEAPYDIFVRWKALHKQPLGWEPDLDDGVRLNIRPFVEAGVLAHVPNVRYGVDGGKDMPSAPWYAVFNGERRNDPHTTLAEKRTARAAKTS